MKPLIVFLLLVGLAWGEVQTSRCTQGDIQGLKICVDNKWIEVALGSETTHEARHQAQDIGQKGHCPHCGAKALEGTATYTQFNYSLRLMKFCPNGHVFWEKE